MIDSLGNSHVCKLQKESSPLCNINYRSNTPEVNFHSSYSNRLLKNKQTKEKKVSFSSLLRLIERDRNYGKYKMNKKH